MRPSGADRDERGGDPGQGAACDRGPGLRAGQGDEDPDHAGDRARLRALARGRDRAHGQPPRHGAADAGEDLGGRAECAGRVDRGRGQDERPGQHGLS